MAIRTILEVPNPVLTTPCEKIKIFDGDTKQIVRDLIDTLNAARKPAGAGLAAPQIGVSKRICIARKFFADPANPEKELSTDVVLINPKIISFSKEKIIGWEGCLSIPNTFGRVERAKSIKVVAADEAGGTAKIKASGFFARVVQHEIDHVDGVLFTSKIVGKTLTERELDERYIQGGTL